MGALLGLLTWSNFGSAFTGIFKGLWKAITGFFGSLNAQGWLGFIVAGLLIFAFLHELGETRHWSKQSARWETLYNKEVTAERKVEADARNLKAQIDSQSSTISAKNKELNDAQDASIAAAANAARMRGPGKAACSGHSILAAPSGGSNETTSAEANAGPQVPSGNWIAVPFDYFVTVLTEHDDLLVEDQTWRTNDAQQRKAWPKP